MRTIDPKLPVDVSKMTAAKPTFKTCGVPNLLAARTAQIIHRDT
jgi:hypothetical protein